MTNLEFMELIKTIGTVIAAIAAPFAGIFAYKNWKRTTQQDAPRAYLKDPEPGEDGLVETMIVVESRDTRDVHIDSIVLDCGAFVGDAFQNEYGEVTGYKRGNICTMQEKLLVPSQEKREIFVRFHAHNPKSIVTAKIESSGDVQTIRLEERR